MKMLNTTNIIQEPSKPPRISAQSHLEPADCQNLVYADKQNNDHDFSSLISIKLFFILIIFYLLVSKTNCALRNPISNIGPFYTEQFQIENNLFIRNSSSTFAYNGWSFTSNANPIPNEYVVLSIQTLDIRPDNSYLTFKILNQVVSQSSLSLQISFCQTTPGCFSTVTFRMLAIDYNFLQGGTYTYHQVKNSIFVLKLNMIGVTTINFTYTPLFNSSQITNWQSVSIIPFIRGFRLLGPSNFAIENIGGSLDFYSSTSATFQFSLTFQQSQANCQAEFQMILFKQNVLTSTGKFAIPFSLNNYQLNKDNQIRYNQNTNGQYIQAETLVLGINKFRLSSVRQLVLNTTVTDARSFSTDSAAIFGLTSGTDYISMYFFIIKKTICVIPYLYYLQDINMCSNLCPFYIRNIVICRSCSNLPTCLKCNSTSCISCDVNTRNFTTTGECLPLNGYYQNNQTIASPCCGNCSICSSNIGCNTCLDATYFYTSKTNQCLKCTDIFGNCTLCVIQNSTTICQTCDYQHYFDFSQQKCLHCVPNCTVCVNQNSCSSCLNSSYVYVNVNNQCQLCSLLFSNCQTCSNSNSLAICSNCDSSYYFNLANMNCQNCVSNCTTCINANSCSSCIFVDYFYWSPSNKCLLCQDIFSNCLTCSVSNSTVICLFCENSYYFNSDLPGCEKCVFNCLSCVNKFSCNSCLINYFYWNATKMCQLCQDIFSNCLACGTVNSNTICQTCNSSFYINPTLPGCQPCVQNCIDCSNGISCNQCQSIDYYYWSSFNKCLICQDRFSNCIECSNYSENAQCTQCSTYYFLDYTGLQCRPCVQNCKNCINNKSCSQCANNDYFYWIPQNKCLLCPDIYNACVNCSENSKIQYGVQCIACEPEHILIINSTFLKCSKQCGDSAIQGKQSCDDGNLINSDGCNNFCEVQDNFTCLSVINKFYPDFNTSHCIYTSPIQIFQKYLEKIPNQNKVELRFNFYPKLKIFQSLNFSQNIINSIEIIWDGCINQTLKAYKIKNALQNNGLFGVSFSYDQQWSHVQAIFIPQNTGLCVFTQNCISSRFLQELDQNQSQQQTKNIQNRRLLVSTFISTPSTVINLPQKSSNNLQMFSDSYYLYDLVHYSTYFFIGIVWIFWIIGLFYGKIVVIDFFIILQIILLCSMTIGILNPAFAGMMSDSFVFLCFTDLFNLSYQIRPIYENIDLEFKSANISYHAMANLNLMVFLVSIVIIIGIIGKICAKIKKNDRQKKQLFQNIFKYCFGQVLFYVFMPFSLNGSLSTILYIKTFVKGEVQIQMMDIISLVVFNTLVIFFLVLFLSDLKNLGQFKSQFLRFDISQQFYLLTMLYTMVLGVIFGILSEMQILGYFCALPIFIFACILLFAICKRPYLQKRHMVRIILNKIFGIILISSILVVNITDIKMLREYLPVAIVLLQILLAIITAYFMYKSVRVEGMYKFEAFLILLEQKKNEKYESVSMKGEKQNKIYFLTKATVKQYQKKSKLLNNIKMNNQPPNMLLNYEQVYQNLSCDILNEQKQNRMKKKKKKKGSNSITTNRTKTMYQICQKIQSL